VKRFLLIIFIVILATSIILKGLSCKKKADSAGIDSTEADINGTEVIKIEPVIKNKIAFDYDYHSTSI
jgi:hypothetical protein